ncbi:unnamed protein product, partial [Coregonus sp. 'balchen']
MDVKKMRHIDKSPTMFCFYKKLEPEDGEAPKTLVKLRRTPSDTPRPASTPPVIATSAMKDEDDEERIIAELEVGFLFFLKIFQRTPVKVSPSHSLPSTLPRPTPAARTLLCTSGSLGRKSTVAARLKHLQQGSLERPKTRKQKDDFPKIQGQQQ